MDRTERLLHFASVLLPTILLPQIQELLEPEEWTGLDFRASDKVLDGDREGDEIDVRITAVGEEFWFQVFDHEDDDSLAERFRGSLQDWIAETAFGWGQLRD
ncbi:hypothetical protein GCM10025867_51560 (plasmid) [Frondihabitans sucicola]|uniref:Uncharacterized protein n=1 Tax=Frondihabitans sucicola TaxID=1268041 RepID=A0ABM8GV48_9MICO|nr:hypothetical protein [Frondihabitans sucicola]BDZ52348.1 hypothetical protein GCM10025867_45890 [Frondihabitans sucicola]BDZ52915.1 hypothetical protein GCM10025867_51560 [Frondihabitans sucicola]